MYESDKGKKAPKQEGFHSVVVITCASHAQGRRFEPGWKQTYFSSFASLPFVADVDDTH